MCGFPSLKPEDRARSPSHLNCIRLLRSDVGMAASRGVRRFYSPPSELNIKRCFIQLQQAITSDY